MSRPEHGVGQVLRRARLRLEKAGVDSPALDAELLLAHVLGCGREALLAHPQRSLTPIQWRGYSELIARRSRREPVAYIIGRKPFYDLEIAVDRRTLIPRPETEELVEWAIGWLGSQPAGHRPIVLDVCTGSGAIALAIARHCPQAWILALDISPAALEVARANLIAYGMKGQVLLIAGDLLRPIRGPVDLILANPPYIAMDQFEGLMPEVHDFEPALALQGGATGVEVIGRLLSQAGQVLGRGGAIGLEIGAGQGETVSELAVSIFPRATFTLRKDLAGLDRIFIVQTEQRQ